MENFKHFGINDIRSNEKSLSWKGTQDFLEMKDRERGKLASFNLLKKSGGRYNDFCCRLPWQWNNRSFIVTSGGVMYYSEPSKEIKEYMPFNNKCFKIFCGKVDTGFDKGIRLEANHRKLLLYAEEYYSFFRFVYIIK